MSSVLGSAVLGSLVLGSAGATASAQTITLTSPADITIETTGSASLVFFSTQGAVVATGSSVIKVKQQSLSISEQANGRNTMSCTLVKVPADAQLQQGATVRLFVFWALRFAGTIESTAYTYYPGRTDIGELQLGAVDFNQLADRRIVSASYDDRPAGEMARLLVEQYLTEEGVSIGLIDPGPTSTRAVFPYMPLSQALTELAGLGGYGWEIDYQQRFYFRPWTSNPAPFSITSLTGILSLNLQRSRDQYRNVQWFLGGRDTIYDETEDFNGDGVQRTFTVGLPLASDPSVWKVAGTPPSETLTPQVVGVKGQAVAGDQFLYALEDPVLQQVDTETPIPVGEKLRVTYDGYAPLVIQQLDVGQIKQRQAIEGGSGYYEVAEVDETIDTIDNALEKAQGLLRRFGKIPIKISLSLASDDFPLAAGLRAGQALRVTLSEYGGIDDDFVVQSLSVRDSFRDGAMHLVIEMELVDGELYETWADLIRKLIQRGRQTALRENELLTLARGFADDASIWFDTFDASILDPVWAARIDAARIGLIEVCK